MRTENESQVGGVKQLGGINQRAAFALLQEGEFQNLVGTYPSKAGRQERLVGKELIKPFSSPIKAIFQTFDSRGNIIIQTESEVHVYSLDELLSREYIPTN